MNSLVVNEAVLQAEQAPENEVSLSLAQRIASSRVARSVLALAATGGAAMAVEAFVPDVAQATPWSHYGGDPQHPGGTHSELAFQHHVASASDRKSFKLMGIPGKGIKAIERSAEEGHVKLDHHSFGTVVPKMTYDPNVYIEYNAKFEDPRYTNGFDAYETTGNVTSTKDVTRRVHGVKESGTETTKESWTIGEPTVCGNVGEFATHKTVKYVWHKPAKKAPKAPEAPSAVLNLVQEVDEGQQDEMLASVTAPAGDKLNVCFSAKYGSFAISCIAETGQGSPEKVTDDYTAPTETGTDKVTTSVYDSTSGLNNLDQSNGENVIKFTVQTDGTNPS